MTDEIDATPDLPEDALPQVVPPSPPVTPPPAPAVPPAPALTPDVPSELGELDVPAPKVKKKKDKDKKKKAKKDKVVETTVVVEEVTPGWVRWAAAAMALVLIVLAVVAVQQHGRADDAKAERRDRKAAEIVAGDFAQTLFTFDGSDPTASLDKLKRLATAAYQPKVDDARQTALAGKGEGDTTAAMTARVTDVYLTELDGDEAHAVTRADWLLNASGQTLALDLYLRIDLKREGGAWKVDTVSALTAKQPPGSTTATTAPTTGSTVAGGAASTTVPVSTTASAP